MSRQPPTLAQQKELLLMRSALCRLRLHRATHGVRASIGGGGFGAAARLLGLAGRMLLVAKLARSFISFKRAFGR